VLYEDGSMRNESGSIATRVLRVAAAVLLLAVPTVAGASDFEERLERVDHGIRKNPAGVTSYALSSCLARRNFAVALYETGHTHRAGRSLKYCEHVLGNYELKPAILTEALPSMEEMQARAGREVERALALEPDIDAGLTIYRDCAMCHMPEGWGLLNGSVPQIAGQHWKVVVKQLADIRAGNRDNPLMAPYSSVRNLGGAQGIANVAGYISTLEMSVGGDKGPGEDLELGEQLYRENCVRCHGANGEGDNDRFVPRIQAQHYDYLVRQFQWIRDGKRRSGDPEMAAQIRAFGEREMHAILDYVSRLEPPVELQAPPGWANPDFVEPVVEAAVP
jgi:cytochrome c553